MMGGLIAGSRSAAVGLTLLVSLRFAYVAGSRWWQSWEPSGHPQEQSRAEPRSALSLIEQASHEREHLLEALAEQSAQVALAPPAPRVLKRNIMVDWGPPRSAVFIGGELVGQTPYGGHLTCVEGSPVEVLVLPEQGAPIKRRYSCTEGEPPATDPEESTSVSNMKPVPAH